MTLDKYIYIYKCSKHRKNKRIPYGWDTLVVPSGQNEKMQPAQKKQLVHSYVTIRVIPRTMM